MSVEVRSAFETRVARVVLGACLGGLILVGAVSAASTPGGRIVFATTLPASPLPDNFQTPQVFSVAVRGGARRELNPSPIWIWSRDRSRIYFTRDTASGAEVWVENGDGIAAKQLAVLPGSAPATSLDWSPDFSSLDVVAGGLWVVRADGSGLRSVFSPTVGTSVSGVRWTRDGSSLVFIAGDAWTVGADGSGLRRLFAAPAGGIGIVGSSPDGSRLVVGAGDTWLVGLDDGVAVRLSSEEVDGVDWSRDGRAFALEGVSLANCGTGSTKCAEWYLQIFDRDGAPLGRIDEARDAAWAPDGKRLVFESGAFAIDPEDGTIDVANRDGSGRRELTALLGKSCWAYPAWHDALRVTFEESACDPESYEPSYRTVVVDVASGRVLRSIAGSDLTPSRDGALIAYLHPTGDRVVLYVVTAAGRKPRRLSSARGVVDEAAWSPGGRFIAFTYASGGDEQVYVVPSRGGRPRRLTHEVRGSWEGGLIWSADGRRLTYSSELDTLPYEGLWTMAPDGTDVRQLTHDSGSEDSSPDWSPDGRRVAFSRIVDGNTTEIDVIGAGGTGERRAVGKAHERDANPAWSPDGRRFAFVREGTGSNYVAVAGAGGSHVHVFRNASGVSGTPSWSPDGSEIVYAEYNSGIYRLAPDGTQKRQLVKADCTPAGCPYFGDPAFSSDGTRIAFVCGGCDSSGSYGIWVMGADGSDVHRVVASRYASRPSWSGDGSLIVFSGTACAAPPAADAPPVSQLCVIGADGSNLHDLTSWPFGSHAPNWSG